MLSKAATRMPLLVFEPIEGMANPRLPQHTASASGFSFPAHTERNVDSHSNRDLQSSISTSLPLHNVGQDVGSQRTFQSEEYGNSIGRRVPGSGAESQPRQLGSLEGTPITFTTPPGGDARNRGNIDDRSTQGYPSIQYPRTTETPLQSYGQHEAYGVSPTTGSSHSLYPDSSSSLYGQSSITTNSPTLILKQLPIPNPHHASFPLVLNPPNLAYWRERLFNIVNPINLSEEEYYTYFPHVDNVYSHRSTQKYRQKPFVSHYWECRLKGRPSGTKKSDDPLKKKRKRVARERDLCDVKIKVIEWFGWEDCRRLGLGYGSILEEMSGMDQDEENASFQSGTQLNMTGMGTTVLNRDGAGSATPTSYLSPVASGQLSDSLASSSMSPSFGMLEPRNKFPKGHPGAEGKRWFTIRRVKKGMNPEESTGADIGSRKSIYSNQGHEDDTRKQHEQGEGVGGSDNTNLDHKHTLEESDRIKKNTIQRWSLKEKQKQTKERRSTQARSQTNDPSYLADSPSSSPSSSAENLSKQYTRPYLASGEASLTVKSRQAAKPSHLTFYANGFCPFAQRIWIALELKEIPYQFIEVVPRHLEEDTMNPSTAAHIWPEILEVNPEGAVPCIRQGNWAVWESGVMLEYLEDLTTGHSLLPLGDAKLRAHCRLWTDHINRKILPSFYALLLTPPDYTNISDRVDQQYDASSSDPRTGNTDTSISEQHQMLISTLQSHITQLVNASHAVGPFFLGTEMSFVDVAFAPWIIRLSRVLNYYRHFPRPEVGTRWQAWVDAVESNEQVQRTVSEEGSYHSVYEGVDYSVIAPEGAYVGDGNDPSKKRKRNDMVELDYARKIIRLEGFGLGGDVWGQIPDRHRVE